MTHSMRISWVKWISGRAHISSEQGQPPPRLHPPTILAFRTGHAEYRCESKNSSLPPLYHLVLTWHHPWLSWFIFYFHIKQFHTNLSMGMDGWDRIYQKKFTPRALLSENSKSNKLMACYQFNCMKSILYPFRPLLQTYLNVNLILILFNLNIHRKV